MCRLACGGHGYLLSSGLPTLLNSYTAMCTLEGTRDVLEQQAARYFLKRVPNAELAPPVPLDSVALLDLTALEAAFEHRAIQVTRSTRALLGAAAGGNGGTAWNDALQEVARVSRAHCHHTLLAAFRSTVDAHPAGATRDVLAALCQLFALSILVEHLGDFLQYGLILPTGVPAARAHVRALLLKIRPEAVALADSWDFSDHYLNSAIGSSDGRVYERLMAAAEREPLNRVPPQARFERVLQPMLRGKL